MIVGGFRSIQWETGYDDVISVVSGTCLTPLTHTALNPMVYPSEPILTKFGVGIGVIVLRPRVLHNSCSVHPVQHIPDD